MFLRPHDLIFYFCFVFLVAASWVVPCVIFLTPILRRLLLLWDTRLIGCCAGLEVPLLNFILFNFRIQITRTVFNEHAAAVSGFPFSPQIVSTPKDAHPLGRG